MGKLIKCVFLFVMMFVVCSLAENAFAGLIMEQVRYQRSDSKRDKGTIYISDNKMKFIEGGGQMAVIFNLNSGEMTQIDNGKKRYVVGKPEDYFKFIQDATAKARAEMEAQLSQLPPEQRAQMEKIMKSQGLTLPGRSEPTKLSLKNVGTSETIEGYKSLKFEVYRDGKISREIWTSKDVVPDKELDSKKMASYMKEMERVISNNQEAVSSNLDEEAKIFNQIYESGFPMKSVSYLSDNSAYVEEIVKVTESNISDKEFQAPADYKRVTLEEMMSLE